MSNIKKLYEDNKKFIKKGIVPIYHGIDYEHIGKIFSTQELEPRNTQRYWSDGLIRKENWDNYNDSYWSFGWALTRSASVALEFGALVMVFDRNKLANNFKLIPSAWNYHFNDEYERKINHKKEKEEFMLSKKSMLSKNLIEKEKKDLEENVLPTLYQTYKLLPKTTSKEKRIKKLFKEMIEEKEKKLMLNFSNLLDIPQGKNLDLKKYMIGFYLNNDIVSIYEESNDELIKELKKNPLYLGDLNDNRILKKMKPKTI